VLSGETGSPHPEHALLPHIADLVVPLESIPYLNKFTAQRWRRKLGRRPLKNLKAGLKSYQKNWKRLRMRKSSG